MKIRRGSFLRLYVLLNSNSKIASGRFSSGEHAKRRYVPYHTSSRGSRCGTAERDVDGGSRRDATVRGWNHLLPVVVPLTWRLPPPRFPRGATVLPRGYIAVTSPLSSSDRDVQHPFEHYRLFANAHEIHHAISQCTYLYNRYIFNGSLRYQFVRK